MRVNKQHADFIKQSIIKSQFLIILLALIINANISFSQEMAPDFRLPDLKGNQVSLKSLLGKNL